jgi:hypothetical protein
LIGLQRFLLGLTGELGHSGHMVTTGAEALEKGGNICGGTSGLRGGESMDA